MVDCPDTLKRQNSSAPAKTPADTQATGSSNKRRASRKTIHTATKNKSWLKPAIHRSGKYSENCLASLMSG